MAQNILGMSSNRITRRHSYEKEVYCGGLGALVVAGTCGCGLADFTVNKFVIDGFGSSGNPVEVTAGANASVTVQFEGGAGNAEEPKSVSFKIDQTKPEWNAEGVSAVRTLGSILELDLAARASDATSGVASVSATLNGVPWDGSATVLTQPGNNILVVTVKDYAGNVYTTGELNIPVHYVFSGFEDYTRVIKRGSTVPFKFKVTDEAGVAQPDAFVTKMEIRLLNENGEIGEYFIEPIDCAGKSNPDGVWRYPKKTISTSNWKTSKTEQLGTYRVTIWLNDGSEHHLILKLGK